MSTEPGNAASPRAPHLTWLLFPSVAWAAGVLALPRCEVPLWPRSGHYPWLSAMSCRYSDGWGVLPAQVTRDSITDRLSGVAR